MEFPVPLEAPLIFGLGVTVQLKTVPLTDELKLILVDAFEQIDCKAGLAVTLGVGLMVILYVDVIPGQAAVPVVVAVAI